MVVDSPSDEEIRKFSLEGEYFKKKDFILRTKKKRWPSDWSYLRFLQDTCQNLGISSISYFE